ncbi:MAG: response regulator transcription factor [Bacteroidota bacterium]|nr:response regulator transcription factor [Bacteroidota bacterium]
MKRFLLIDDHFVVRSGIRGLLMELYKPCEVYESENSEQAVNQLRLRSYDLIIMDVQIPKNDMLGLMEYIHIKYPAAKVLMFSMSPENIYAKRFLKAGARGFLPKDSSFDETLRAINLVLNNRKYISDSLAESLAEDTLSDNPVNPFDRLSSREFEIASLLLNGQNLSEIARTLNLQPSTVGTHKAKLFKKMNVENVLHLKELASMYINK